MEIPEIWTSQIVGHDKLCISHLQEQDIVSETLAIEIDNLQLQAGVPWPVMSPDGTVVQYYVA